MHHQYLVWSKNKGGQARSLNDIGDDERFALNEWFACKQWHQRGTGMNHMHHLCE